MDPGASAKMNFSFGSPAFQSFLHRSVAIVLLLLLHIAVIGYLLTLKIDVVPAPRDVREIVFSLVSPRPLPEPPPPRPLDEKAKNSKRASAPEISPAFASPPVQQPDVSGIGHTLFDCDLDRNLTAEQRAGCTRFAALPPSADSIEAGMPKKSLSVQSARWAAAIARRNEPLQVRCTYLTNVPLPLIGGQSKLIPMVDPICIFKGLRGGFGPPK